MAAKYRQDLYDILQVHPKAEEEVIKAAYKALVVKHHPDKGGDKSLAARIIEAHDVLIGTDSRKAYDEYLRSQNKGRLGPYEVLEQIGEGAFGYTYKGRHILLDELACLKQNIHISPEDTEIITREAKLLWKIHHYSLPTLRDFFKTGDGSCVIAMTYVDGMRLDKIVEKYDKIDPEQVCGIAQRILNALNYLHYHGIVHCDVKPNNIIIKGDEHNAVLVDYGFASLRPRRQTHPEGYTEVFAPPEILKLKPPLPQSDLYSLALTMIFALGGDPRERRCPPGTPKPLKDYFESFLSPNPLGRPSWDKHDLVKELTDIRMNVFKRKSMQKPWVIS